MNIDNIKNIKIEDFDYPLPDSRIALHPIARRDACKLIVSHPDGKISHEVFSNLPEFIPATAMLICNETRVINARMEFFRPSGARIEVFLLEPYNPADYVISFASTQSCEWTCMIGNLKKWKDESLRKELHLPGREAPVILSAMLLPAASDAPQSASRQVRFSWDAPDVTFAEIVECAGNIPIPPYLKRASEASDLDDYQTIYSRVKGSVAAPTAGLHFTPELFSRLTTLGIDIRKVTLHVGAGTFQPVKSENIGDHPMHTESIFVPVALIREIADALESGRPIFAVGTTSVRTLESLPILGYLASKNDGASIRGIHLPQWLAYSDELVNSDTIALLRQLADAIEAEGDDHLSASTAIMIAPGFRWRIVSGMVTNFHQPQSTLLLLVSSFLDSNLDPASIAAQNLPRWRQLYDEALSLDYRFLSYGDACLLFPLNDSGSNPESNQNKKQDSVTLPLSKSIALRAMTLSAVSEALGNPPANFSALPDATDVAGLQAALDALKDCRNSVYIGEGGAPIRFFTALAASIEGVDIEVSASEGLMRRPMGILIDALRSLGADIQCLGREGYPPLRIKGNKLLGGVLTIDPSMSSQYVSALMMAAPLWKNGLQLHFSANPVSKPYIRMTERLMRYFGCEVSSENLTVSVASGRCAAPAKVEIESDWSAASYFYELALLRPGREVKIRRLTPPEESLQGDSRCAELFARAGVQTRYNPNGSAKLLRELSPTGNDSDKRALSELSELPELPKLKEEEILEADMNDTPDLVPALAVGLPLAGIPFRFRGVAHLKIKETDRLAALIAEMRKLGYELTSDGETLAWEGKCCEPQEEPEIETYADHRMAMAFAPAALLFPGLKIPDPAVVAKSFPNFFQEFLSLTSNL